MNYQGDTNINLFLGYVSGVALVFHRCMYTAFCLQLCYSSYCKNIKYSSELQYAETLKAIQFQYSEPILSYIFFLFFFFFFFNLSFSCASTLENDNVSSTLSKNSSQCTRDNSQFRAYCPPEQSIYSSDILFWLPCKNKIIKHIVYELTFCVGSHTNTDIERIRMQISKKGYEHKAHGKQHKLKRNKNATGWRPVVAAYQWWPFAFCTGNYVFVASQNRQLCKR